MSSAPILTPYFGDVATRFTRWCIWLRQCTTSRKVAGSIPTSCVLCGATDTLLHRLTARKDKNQDGGNTTHTPQTHTRGVDPTPEFSSLALPKPCGDNVDCGPSSNIPSTNAATPLFRRLHGLPATSPLERVPLTDQDTRSREVSRSVIVLPPPSTRFVFTSFLPIQYGTENPMDSKHHHHPAPTLSDLIRLRRRNVEYDTTYQ